MTDLENLAMSAIQAHRLPGLDAGPNAIYPHYGGYSLYNLPASVLHWLGIQSSNGVPHLAEPIMQRIGGQYRNVILLVVDGLGYELFKRFLTFEPWVSLLPRAVFTPLTSISPSTTAAALTTLWTGASPAAHGTVGYEVFLKEYGLIANNILHSPASFYGDAGSLRRAGFDPETFLPVGQLGPVLRAHGVHPYAFQPSVISGSGLSQMLLQDASVIPYRTVSDLGTTLGELLRANREGRNYYYVYWSDIDTLSHRFGPDDERVLLEFENFSHQFAILAERFGLLSQEETLFLMVADHGLIHTPLDPHLELRNHPEFNQHLTMVPSGENRLAYLYVRDGHSQAVLDYVERAWPARFKLVRAEEVLAAELMGPRPAYARLPDRLGDWVVFPQGSDYWWWANRDNPMLGRHGGLSPEEMLIPFFAVANP